MRACGLLATQYAYRRLRDSAPRREDRKPCPHRGFQEEADSRDFGGQARRDIKSRPVVALAGSEWSRLRLWSAG